MGGAKAHPGVLQHTIRPGVRIADQMTSMQDFEQNKEIKLPQTDTFSNVWFASVSITVFVGNLSTTTQVP